MEKMTAKVLTVKSIIGESLTNSHVRNLLNRHRWDTEKFLDEFFINDTSSIQETETTKVIKENLDPALNKKKKKSKDSQHPVESAAASSSSSTRPLRVTRSQARKREYQFEFQQLSSEPPRKIRISALSEQNSFTEGSIDVVTCEICFDLITTKVLD